MGWKDFYNSGFANSLVSHTEQQNSKKGIQNRTKLNIKLFYICILVCENKPANNINVLPIVSTPKCKPMDC